MAKEHSKLDPLMEGYLEYMLAVERREAGTIKDIRCTLRRVSEAFAQRHPDKSLWELKLTDFIAWLEQERKKGYSVLGLCKNVSHLRGFLNYAWRSGRSHRNVMADFFPEYRCAPKEPESLTVDEALHLVEMCPFPERACVVKGGLCGFCCLGVLVFLSYARTICAAR